MEFPARGLDIINQLYQRHRDLAEASDDSRRELTRMMGEQFAFEFGPQWGVKSAGSGRPQGPSEIAFDSAPVTIWRWSDGDGHVTGTPWSPLPQPLLQPINQSFGQIFIVCDPVNRLAVDQPGPAPAPVEPAPVSEPAATPDTVKELLAGVKDLTTAVNQLTTRIVELRQNGIRLRFP